MVIWWWISFVQIDLCMRTAALGLAKHFHWMSFWNSYAVSRCGWLMFSFFGNLAGMVTPHVLWRMIALSLCRLFWTDFDYNKFDFQLRHFSTIAHFYSYIDFSRLSHRAYDQVMDLCFRSAKKNYLSTHFDSPLIYFISISFSQLDWIPWREESSSRWGTAAAPIINSWGHMATHLIEIRCSYICLELPDLRLSYWTGPGSRLRCRRLNSIECEYCSQSFQSYCPLIYIFIYEKWLKYNIFNFN